MTTIRRKSSFGCHLNSGEYSGKTMRKKNVPRGIGAIEFWALTVQMAFKLLSEGDSTMQNHAFDSSDVVGKKRKEKNGIIDAPSLCVDINVY